MPALAGVSAVLYSSTQGHTAPCLILRMPFARNSSTTQIVISHYLASLCPAGRFCPEVGDPGGEKNTPSLELPTPGSYSVAKRGNLEVFTELNLQNPITGLPLLPQSYFFNGVGAGAQLSIPQGSLVLKSG